MKRIVFYIVYPFLWFLSLLPLPILYIKSSVLYFVVYYIVGYRKKVVKGNLRLVFPDKSASEIVSISKEFYKHLCDMIFENIKSISISEKELTKRFSVENSDYLDRLYKDGKNVLLLCGHYASWEWSGLIGKNTLFERYAVYKKLDNSSFDNLIKRIRGRFGASIIPNKQIAKVLYRSFKEGKQSLTLILSDQTPKLGSFKDRQAFMGIDVPVFTGTEELAKLLGFSTVYLHIEKVKRGYYKAKFIPLAEDPKAYPDFEITRLFLNEIEKQIYAAPAYYLWSHKRWKHRN